MTGRLTGLGAAVALVMLWSAAPVKARDLPDLVIAKAELRASGDCSGRTPLITGKVHVRNAGIGRGQIFTTKEMIASQVEGRADIRGGDRFVNSMKPGETVVVEVRIGGAQVHGVAGRQTVLLTVDPNDVFEEENERNNALRVTVAVNCR